MKKTVVFLSIAALLFMSCPAHADTPLKKLGRGLANILTCPLEIPKGIGDANAESGPVAAMTFGVLQGIFKTCVRGVVGVYETVSFPIPLPADYAPILMDPEFFLEQGLF
jgi:putative exosortase-associated protein (TIGR04073 family)